MGRKLLLPISLSILFVCLSLPAEKPACRGLVAESVVSGSTADKAGIRKGDVLLSWERRSDPAAGFEDKKSVIRSPFEFLRLEIEESQRWPLLINAERDGKTINFELSPGNLGLSVYPFLDREFNSEYRDSIELVRLNEFEKGADQLLKIADKLEQTGNLLLSCWFDIQAGEISVKGKNLEKAAGILEKARIKAGNLRDPIAEFKVFLLTGDSERAKNEFINALKCYANAEKTANEAFGENLFVATALNRSGGIANILGNLDGAEQFYGKALVICEKIAPESIALSTNLTNMGVIARKKGDIGSAEQFQRKALGINEKIAPDSLSVAASLTNLGVLASDVSDLEAAERFHLKALAIREKISPESLDVAGSLNNLGIIASKKGELSSAGEYFKRGLAIRKKHAPESLSVADNLNNIGAVALTRGNFAEAEELYRQSLTIREKLAPESLDRGSVFTNLGHIALIRSEITEAEDYYNRALSIREKYSPVSIAVASSLNNLGNLFFTEGDFEKADEFYKRALTVSEKLAPMSHNVADSLNNIGNVALLRNDLETAEKYLKEALTIRENIAPRSLPVSVVLNNLGSVSQSRGDMLNAEIFFKKALGIVEVLAPATLDEAEVLYNLGLLEKTKNQPELALEYFSKTVDSFENQVAILGGGKEARENFSARYADYYRDLVEIQVQLGRKEEAFNTLERFRARNLLEMLAERDIDFSIDAPPALLKEQNELNFRYSTIQDELTGLSPEKDAETIETLMKEMQEIRNNQSKLKDKMKSTSPKLASLQYPEPLGYEQIKSIFGENILFLSYCTGVSDARLFALQNGELEIYTIPVKREELQKEISLYRKLVTGPQSDSGLLTKKTAQIYNMLLKPAQKQIKKTDCVIICPDGPLHSMPFCALKATKRTSLTDKKQILHVISATVLSELKKQQKTENEKMAAFGNPVYPDTEIEDAVVRSVTGEAPLLPLPATENELGAIEGIYREKAIIYKRETATEENAKSQGKELSIIHFACHGILDERFPLNSGLALTIPGKREEEKENGLLQAWEIFEQVRINADLVTLSACETGLGKEMGGEGMIGLTRAFQYAGAKAVLSSLWSVSDESTAKLMSSFYAHLKTGKSKAEALRMAQSKMMRSKKYAHPFYWAGFVLNGDWE